jgi:hypothetical protein
MVVLRIEHEREIVEKEGQEQRVWRARKDVKIGVSSERAKCYSRHLWTWCEKRARL